MSEETHKRTKIKNYLLGELTFEEEIQEIERQLLSDDDFFEEYLIEESALVQDYVDGLLNEIEQANFEQHYLISEERLEKVRFTRAFRQYVNEQGVENETELKKQEKGESVLAYLKKIFLSPIPVTVGVFILIAFGGFAIWKIFRKSSEQDAMVSFNKAYEKERPLESRISGLNYAPTNNLRGKAKEKVDTTERNLARSIALTNASQNPTPENLHSLGRIYLAEKNFDEAIVQLEKAEQSAPQNAEILSDLGVGYLERGKRLSDGSKLDSIAKALQTIDKALQLNPNLLEARFNKAIALQEINSIEEAKKAWRDYLELDSNSKWADEARQYLELLGEAQPEKTREIVLEEFLNAYRNKDDDLAWKISSLNREMIKGKLIPQQLALEFLKASDNDQKKEFLEALKYAGALENQKRKDSYFSEIAQFYANTSASQQSLLKDAQEAMLQGFDLSLHNDYEPAHQKFKQAQDLFTQANDVWEAKLAEYWAAFEFELYHPDLVEYKNYLATLAEFCRQKNYNWFLAEVYIWQGVAAEESTEYSKAIEYHKKAEQLCEEISEIYNLEKTLSILADEYTKLRQYDRALDFFQKSLALSVKYPETSSRQKWRTLNTGAAVLYSLKYYAASIAFEEEALAIGEQTKDRGFSSDAILKLGVIYGQQQKYDEAVKYLNQSIELAESLNEESTVKKYSAEPYRQLGNIKRLSGDCDGALEYYEKAVESSMASNKPKEYAARKGRLLCYVEQKNDSALESEIPVVLNLFEENRQKITEESIRNTFFDNEQDVYDLAINYKYLKGDYKEAYNLSEVSHSRSLLDLLKNGGKFSDEDAEINLPQPAAPLKLDDIENSISDKVQIVQYAVLDDKVLIWLIKRNELSVFDSQIAANELNEKVDSYLRNLSDQSEDSSEEVGNLSKQLYQILIAPVREKLDPQKQIVFVPDKFLFRLPFQSLISPVEEKYLVEDFTIFYSPSANVFLVSSDKAKKEAPNKNEKLLAIGNPSFDRNEFPDLPSLPSAEKEAADAANIYVNPIKLVKENANEKNIKQDFPKADIVHFAGHYVVNNASPLRSFLLLAGNGDEAALSNYELIKENLAPHTKLIILSACQTGVERYYNGEGMIGAARVFLGMGIPLVVASQWQVDSEATRILMTKFHQYRKQKKLPSAVALRHAQIDMLNAQDKNFRKPYYWAAFAPIGGYTQF